MNPYSKYLEGGGIRRRDPAHFHPSTLKYSHFYALPAGRPEMRVVAMIFLLIEYWINKGAAVALFLAQLDFEWNSSFQMDGNGFILSVLCCFCAIAKQELSTQQKILRSGRNNKKLPIVQKKAIVGKHSFVWCRGAFSDLFRGCLQDTSNFLEQYYRLRSRFLKNFFD